MTSHSALSSLHAATVLALSPSAPISARPQRLSRALPAQPSAIPVRANEQFASEGSLSPLPLQRKLAIGSSNDPLEAEAETVAARVVGVAPAAGPSVNSAPPALRRHPTGAVRPVEAPPIVHQALCTAGRPLDAHTRAFMEPRIGHDLSAVRIHTGPRAEESAQAVHALAYTVGQDTVFAAGQYNPQSAAGRSLLAHELSHTVQQAGGSAHSHLSSAAPALYRQSKPDTPPQQTAPQDTSNQKPKSDQVTINISWDDLLNRKLTPLSLLEPRQHQPQLPSPGTLTLGGATAPVAQNPYSPPFGFSPPLNQPAPSLFQPGPYLTPPGASPVIPSNPPGQSPLAPLPSQQSGSTAGGSSSAPSRLSLKDIGTLSLGLRLGFPEMEEDDKPGAPPSALKESLQKGEILNYMITGQLPSAYQLDKGKLAGAIWGIFSTYIAPDVARKIASGMSSKHTSKGISYELDAVLLTDFSGGGVSLTLKY